MDSTSSTACDQKHNTYMVTGQGKMETTELGAKRESNEGRGRFDLLPYEAIEALAKWYEAGSQKYEERNWEKGISVKDCINRMNRHALKAANGWTDEDHLSAVMWNAAAAITMIQRRPDCNDHLWLPQDDPRYKRLQEKATPTLISNDDVYFLISALKSGGINDIESLSGWVDRRKK